jgi:hypothetical protein
LASRDRVEPHVGELAFNALTDRVVAEEQILGVLKEQEAGTATVRPSPGGQAVQDGPQANGADEGDFDVNDTASAQSFPASDPPGWATGTLERCVDQAQVMASARSS